MDSYTAGMLRHQVVLQKFTQSSTDSRGQPVGSWEDEAWLRASIEPVGPREAEMVNQLVHDATHVIVTRYNSGITRERRFTFGDRVMTIGHVADIGNRGRWMRSLCHEEL